MLYFIYILDKENRVALISQNGSNVTKPWVQYSQYWDSGTSTRRRSTDNAHAFVTASRFGPEY